MSKFVIDKEWTEKRNQKGAAYKMNVMSERSKITNFTSFSCLQLHFKIVKQLAYNSAVRYYFLMHSKH